MKQTTDLAQIKEKAVMMLYFEPKSKAGIDFLIDYPYLDTPFGYLKATGKMFNVFLDKDVFDLWRVEMIDFIESRGTIADIMVLFTKPYRLAFFSYISEYLDVVDFTKQLKEIWTENEFPALNCSIINTELSSWFKCCDKDLFMSEVDRNYLDSLPDEVMIYRGVADDKYKMGYSWSLSRDKAEWFATRLTFDGCNPALYSFKVKKSDVVAYLSSRGESEIIVLPETLANYKINCLYL